MTRIKQAAWQSGAAIAALLLSGCVVAPGAPAYGVPPATVYGSPGPAYAYAPDYGYYGYAPGYYAPPVYGYGGVIVGGGYYGHNDWHGNPPPGGWHGNPPPGGWHGNPPPGGWHGNAPPAGGGGHPPPAPSYSGRGSGGQTVYGGRGYSGLPAGHADFRSQPQPQH